MSFTGNYHCAIEIAAHTITKFLQTQRFEFLPTTFPREIELNLRVGVTNGRFEYIGKFMEVSLIQAERPRARIEFLFEEASLFTNANIENQFPFLLAKGSITLEAPILQIPIRQGNLNKDLFILDTVNASTAVAVTFDGDSRFQIENSLSENVFANSVEEMETLLADEIKTRLPDVFSEETPIVLMAVDANSARIGNAENLRFNRTTFKVITKEDGTAPHLVIFGMFDQGTEMPDTAAKAFIDKDPLFDFALGFSAQGFRNHLICPSLARSFNVPIEEAAEKLPPACGTAANVPMPGDTRTKVTLVEDTFRDGFIRVKVRATREGPRAKSKFSLETQLGISLGDGNLIPNFNNTHTDLDVDLKGGSNFLALLPTSIYIQERFAESEAKHQTLDQIGDAIREISFEVIPDATLSFSNLKINPEGLSFSGIVDFPTERDRRVVELEADFTFLDETIIEHGEEEESDGHVSIDLRDQFGPETIPGTTGSGLLGELLGNCSGTYPYTEIRRRNRFVIRVERSLVAEPISVEWRVRSIIAESGDLQDEGVAQLLVQTAYPHANLSHTHIRKSASIQFDERRQGTEILLFTVPEDGNFNFEIVAIITDAAGRVYERSLYLRSQGIRISNPGLEACRNQAAETFRDRIRDLLGKIRPEIDRMFEKPSSLDPTTARNNFSIGLQALQEDLKLKSDDLLPLLFLFEGGTEFLMSRGFPPAKINFTAPKPTAPEGKTPETSEPAVEPAPQPPSGADKKGCLGFLFPKKKK